ncbi:MAG: hypothetical protein ABIL58_15075 [Pseudomonadota bacterium]
MSKQICPVCAHIILPYELCCPVCNGEDLCRDAGYDAGSGDDDFGDMMADAPDQLTTY